MGCGGSTQENSVMGRLTVDQGAELLDTYLRVEKDIWLEEKYPPAPYLGYSMVKLEKLSGELEDAMMETKIEREPAPGDLPGAILDYDSKSFLRHVGMESTDEAIRRALAELGVNRRPSVAAEHEEFVSNLVRKAMREHKVAWLHRMKRETQEEVNNLSDRVQQLQRLYELQDSILGSVMDGRGIELEAEVDRLRSYRDTLHSGEVAWRDAARLCATAARLAAAASDAWAKLPEILNEDTRFRVATECRHAVQESALSIQSAQYTLPGVQFPYCTYREMTALIQVLEYLYTDMNIQDRYKHSARVYDSYHKRAVALFSWVKKMREETILKDVKDVDQKFAEAVNRLCNDRANNMRQVLGLGGRKESLTRKDLLDRQDLMKSDLDRKLTTVPLHPAYDNFDSRILQDHHFK